MPYMKSDCLCCLSPNLTLRFSIATNTQECVRGIKLRILGDKTTVQMSTSMSTKSDGRCCSLTPIGPFDIKAEPCEIAKEFVISAWKACKSIRLKHIFALSNFEICLYQPETYLGPGSGSHSAYGHPNHSSQLAVGKIVDQYNEKERIRLAKTKYNAAAHFYSN